MSTTYELTEAGIGRQGTCAGVRVPDLPVAVPWDTGKFVMPRVTVEPASVMFDAEPGETVMAAARRAGYRWPTVCEMLGQCGVCYVEVRSDPGAMSPMTPLEADSTNVVRLRHPDVEPERLRLACQARVDADVSLYKRGVRASS